MSITGEMTAGLAFAALILILLTYFLAGYRHRSKMATLELQLRNAQENSDQLKVQVASVESDRDLAAKALRESEDDGLRLKKENEFAESEKERLVAQIVEMKGEVLALRQGQAELGAAQASMMRLQRDLDELKSERQQLLKKLEQQTTEAAVLATEREQQEANIRDQKEFLKNSSESLNQQF